MERRRHVLFLIPTLAAGGAERVAVTLLNHIDRSKFRLSLAVVNARGAVFSKEVPDDVEFLDLQVSRVRYALPRLIRLIWRMRPDVVFSALGHLNLALSIIRPMLPSRTQYVARESIVVSELHPAYNFPRAWDWAYRTFYGRFDDVICQSEDMRNDLARNYNIPMQKLKLINNPVDIEKIARLASLPTGACYDCNPESEDVIRLVAAGRLVHQKGFDLLIEAIALSGLKQLRVTVLGDGPLRGALEELAKEKGVENQIRFIGFQENPYAFMARADAFVLSSRYEGFPNAVLEALACGTPVIATPAPGGVGEIARSTRGVHLAAAVSAEALSTALLAFAGRSNAAQITVEHYRVGKIAREYESIFISGARVPGV